MPTLGLDQGKWEKNRKRPLMGAGGDFTAWLVPFGHRITVTTVALPSIHVTPSSQKALIPVGLFDLIRGRNIHLTSQVRKLKLGVGLDVPKITHCFSGDCEPSQGPSPGPLPVGWPLWNHHPAPPAQSSNTMVRTLCSLALV